MSTPEHAPFDLAIEASAYELFALLLRRRHDTLSHDSLSSPSLEPASVKHVCGPVLKASMTGSWSDTTYNAPDMGLEEGERDLQRELRGRLGALTSQFDFVSFHVWDPVSHTRKDILTHFDPTLPVAIAGEREQFLTRYWNMETVYHRFGKRRKTFVEYLDKYTRGWVCVLIGAEAPRHCGDAVKTLPFPKEAVDLLRQRDFKAMIESAGSPEDDPDHIGLLVASALPSVGNATSSNPYALRAFLPRPISRSIF